jgi:permuted papain-like amidase YaeF/Yiix C92 family enzyme
MIHTYEINGIPLQTGDIICSMNGKPDILPGQFWWLVGRLVPGDIDHISIYLGPEGRCIEAGALGVVTFDVSDHHWDAEKMMATRGLLVDTFVGVAYPLVGRGMNARQEKEIREAVAAFCLAHIGKPYNLNFLNSKTEDAFYCSQLAYKAYLDNGLDLNTGLSIENIAGTNQIIFPQEIWNGCAHQPVSESGQLAAESAA